jgi:hypothetical protein
MREKSWLIMKPSVLLLANNGTTFHRNTVDRYDHWTDWVVIIASNFTAVFNENWKKRSYLYFIY